MTPTTAPALRRGACGAGLLDSVKGDPPSSPRQVIDQSARDQGMGAAVACRAGRLRLPPAIPPSGVPMTDAPHILVTGSTRGIGAAVFEALAQRGAKLVGHGRADLDRTVGADLAQAGAADRLWETALERLEGRIDVLVNNAGVFEAVAVDAPDTEWQAAWGRTLQINLQASADLCRRAVLHWRERS